MAADNKLVGLDSLRALAITLVFLFHYGRLFPHPEWANTVSKFGWTGVDLFFVLSGFLIASQLFKGLQEENRVDARTFYVKRVFRILPPYLLVLGAYFAFPYIHEREALAPAWKYLTFTQNIGLDVSKTGTFSHAWSLCIEEQFYLFLPVVLLVLHRLDRLKLGVVLPGVLFCGGLVLRYLLYGRFVAPYMPADDMWVVYWYKWIYYPTFCRLDSLLAGIVVATLFAYGGPFKERICKYGNRLIVAGIGVLLVAYYLCVDETSLLASVAGFPAFAIGYGLVVAGAVSPCSVLYKYGSRVLGWLATLSYAIYLVHKAVVHVTQELLSGMGIPDNSNVMLLCCCIAVAAVAMCMHWLVEKPALYLRNRYLARA